MMYMADPAADVREWIPLGDSLQGAREIVLHQLRDVGLDVDVEWTSRYTFRIPAVQAAAGFNARLLQREPAGHFFPRAAAYLRRGNRRNLARLLGISLPNHVSLVSVSIAFAPPTAGGKSVRVRERLSYPRLF
jgi:hypothetical protein